MADFVSQNKLNTTCYASQAQYLSVTWLPLFIRLTWKFLSQPHEGGTFSEQLKAVLSCTFSVSHYSCTTAAPQNWISRLFAVWSFFSQPQAAVQNIYLSFPDALITTLTSLLLLTLLKGAAVLVQWIPLWSTSACNLNDDGFLGHTASLPS